jgi:hypothetical protein
MVAPNASGSIEVRANEMERELIGQGWGFGWATVRGPSESAEAPSMGRDEPAWSGWGEEQGTRPGLRHRRPARGTP